MKRPDEIKKGLEYLSITNVAQKVEAAKKGLPYAYTEEVADDALALIQQLEAQVPRWISVEERLPKKLMRVLVFKQRNAHALWNTAMWDIEIDWRGESDWSKNPDNGWFTVTHWMPLPQPPKD